MGEWHLRHDQLVTYLKTLADSSDRVVYEEIGRTYEARPLVMLTISSPENLARLEEIRRQHLRHSNPARKPARPLEEMPVIVNMGNPEEVTILELAREVVEILGSRSPIVFEPLPTDDPKLRRPDISRAKALLGWSPRVPRSEGIKRLAAHFSEPPDSWRHTP